MSMQLPTDVRDRYDSLVTELDGFDDGEALARYVLEATAEELERGDGSAASAADSAEDDVVEDRLEQLGYLEK